MVVEVLRWQLALAVRVPVDEPGTDIGEHGRVAAARGDVRFTRHRARTGNR